jgi:hypothetical protein
MNRVLGKSMLLMAQNGTLVATRAFAMAIYQPASVNGSTNQVD